MSFPGAVVLTHSCDTTEGSKITVFGNYSSLPGDPVSWIRPDTIKVVDCQPNVNCLTRTGGYTGTQANTGLEYNLTIDTATNVDFGRWTLQDGNLVLPVTITQAGRFENTTTLPQNTCKDLFCTLFLLYIIVWSLRALIVTCTHRYNRVLYKSQAIFSDQPRKEI